MFGWTEQWFGLSDSCWTFDSLFDVNCWKLLRNGNILISKINLEKSDRVAHQVRSLFLQNSDFFVSTKQHLRPNGDEALASLINSDYVFNKNIIIYIVIQASGRVQCDAFVVHVFVWDVHSNLYAHTQSAAKAFSACKCKWHTQKWGVNIRPPILQNFFFVSIS